MDLRTRQRRALVGLAWNGGVGVSILTALLLLGWASHAWVPGVSTSRLWLVPVMAFGGPFVVGIDLVHRGDGVGVFSLGLSFGAAAMIAIAVRRPTSARVTAAHALLAIYFLWSLALLGLMVT